jgi:hypothetical protein
MDANERLAAADASLFRRVMGRFAAKSDSNPAEVRRAVRGMTANAFMSAHLRPALPSFDRVNAHMHSHLIAAGAAANDKPRR